MNPISTSPNKQIIYWLLTGCFLIYIMVVVGCLTRLTHSGLSITDWSFMGSIPPVNDQMWQERFEKYQQSPEFQKINFSMTLQDFKPIFLWEYIHRMIGRTMMYVFAIGFVYFLIKKKIKKDMWQGFVLLFFMGAMQAVIGWWMVYSGLQSKPAVSHYRLATHLMSAFTLFAFTFWFALRLLYPKENAEVLEGKKLKSATVIFFCVLVFQIIFGAFTAGFVEGNDSHIRPGHIFNTWPKMGDDWIPEQVTMKDSLFENMFENASGIQFVHRTTAIIIVILICFIWYRSNKLQLTKQQHTGITLLIYGVTIQFILGVLTLLYQVPVIMGALHQTGAFFLFLSCIYLLFHLFNKKAIS
ncbi:MAG: COX15/CtaA family protein [Bacteroidetes bacterium]|nr:COX15/CtaA family protein [Bacteroidota bacterium]